jgi:hypothetical protein
MYPSSYPFNRHIVRDAHPPNITFPDVEGVPSLSTTPQTSASISPTYELGGQPQYQAYQSMHQTQMTNPDVQGYATVDGSGTTCGAGIDYHLADLQANASVYIPQPPTPPPHSILQTRYDSHSTSTTSVYPPPSHGQLPAQYYSVQERSTHIQQVRHEYAGVHVQPIPIQQTHAQYQAPLPRQYQPPSQPHHHEYQQQHPTYDATQYPDQHSNQQQQHQAMDGYAVVDPTNVEHVKWELISPGIKDEGMPGGYFQETLSGGHATEDAARVRGGVARVPVGVAHAAEWVRRGREGVEHGSDKTGLGQG